MSTSAGNGQEAREFLRHAAMIPVRVGVAHAWEGSSGIDLPADLINLSCGGASLRVRWVFPPRTRLHVSITAGASGVALLAEVVWTSLLPGRRPEPGVYGIRWVERLTPAALESMVRHVTSPETREDAGGILP